MAKKASWKPRPSDPQIAQLKAELAALEARVKALEDKANVNPIPPA